MALIWIPVLPMISTIVASVAGAILAPMRSACVLRFRRSVLLLILAFGFGMMLPLFGPGGGGLAAIVVGVASAAGVNTLLALRRPRAVRISRMALGLIAVAALVIFAASVSRAWRVSDSAPSYDQRLRVAPSPLNGIVDCRALPAHARTREYHRDTIPPGSPPAPSNHFGPHPSVFVRCVAHRGDR